MKRFLIKVVIGVLALCLGIAVVKYFSPQTSLKPAILTSNNQVVTNTFSKQREQSDTFNLDSYQPIVVSKINGSVVVEYTDVKETEVKVVRSANSDEDFDYRKLVMGGTRGRLEVRMKKSASLWSLLGMIPEERQSVIIRTPHGTRVTTKCINGTVEERETVEGKLEVRTKNYQCSQ